MSRTAVACTTEQMVLGTVGAISRVAGDDGWLLAAGRGFAYLTREGVVHAIADVAPAGTRMNDAACDPQGWLWAGILAAQSTSCAFGGPGLHRLFVTTATENWTDAERRVDPAAGIVYSFDTDATGRPASQFRPDPIWWKEITRRGRA